MQIKPCRDDVGSIIGTYIVIVLCEIGLLFVCEFELFFVIMILIVNVVLSIVLIRDLLYLYRTITIEREGCTFSIGKYAKSYNWCDLNVQLCEAKPFKFYDSDISGPGILICPKSMKYSNKIPYMTSCRYKKPFTSVYIRFKSAEDEKKIIYGKVVYYGYIAERELLMDYLQSIDVTLQ